MTDYSGQGRVDDVRHAYSPLTANHSPLALGYQQVRREWLDGGFERSGTEQLAVGLSLPRRRRLDADAAAGPVQQTRIVAEVLAHEPAHDAERVAQRPRREDAQVEHSVILPNAGAEPDQFVEHGAEVGHHDGRGLPLVRLAVHDDACDERLTAQYGPRRRDRVGEHAEPQLEPRRRLLDHAGVDPHAGGEREAPPVAEPAEIDPRFVTGEQRRHGPPDVERDAEGAGDEIAGAAGQNADGPAGAGE